MIAIVADGRWGRRVVHFVRELTGKKAVTWGVRSTSYARDLLAEEPEVVVSTYAEAIVANPMIVVSMPYQDLLPWVQAYAGMLHGKIIIDLSFPVTEENRLFYGWDTSGSEELQKCLPKSRIVGAKSATIQRLPGRETHLSVSTVYVTSDDKEAKRQVMTCFQRGAYMPIDAGALEENRAIDRIISAG